MRKAGLCTSSYALSAPSRSLANYCDMLLRRRQGTVYTGTFLCFRRPRAWASSQGGYGCAACAEQDGDAGTPFPALSGMCRWHRPASHCYSIEKSPLTHSLTGSVTRAEATSGCRRRQLSPAASAGGPCIVGKPPPHTWHFLL